MAEAAVSRRDWWTLAAALAGLAAGCVIGVGSFEGKSCNTSADCPEPYVCASVRGPAGTCELLRLPRPFDAGEEVPVDYCHDLKPILDRSCVSNCHNASPSYAGSPTTFRLDIYAPLDGGVPGAAGFSGRIQARVSDDSMPPPNAKHPDGGAIPRVTTPERLLVARWTRSGAPFCLGDIVGDAGDGDGGSDGGPARDGGADAGDGG